MEWQNEYGNTYFLPRGCHLHSCSDFLKSNYFSLVQKKNREKMKFIEESFKQNSHFYEK